MRPSALFPALCALVTFVLGFICIFAGDKRNYLEDYHIMTLNTSRIGQTVFTTTSTTSSSDPLTSWISNVTSSNPLTSWISNATSSIENTTSSITSSIENDIHDDINSAVASIAKDLGIKDFYSAHMMDYCYGFYTPQAVASSNVSQSDIHKNVTGCANRTSLFAFDPTDILERELNQSGLGITLDDLEWPSAIQEGLNELNAAWKGAFVLYCIAIGLAGLVMLCSLAGIFFNGRIPALINMLLAGTAFLAILIPSALTTAVAVKGSHVINEFGNDIGIQARHGGKFLAVTWAATATMLLASLAWAVECCIGHRRSRRNKAVTEKP